MMIRRGDRKYREFECSECEIKRHIYEIERENLYYSALLLLLLLLLATIIIIIIISDYYYY